MTKQSAGILLYRIQDEQLQVLLVHPGGPFWRNKDIGAWSIPKGEFSSDEEPLVAAKREFKEETGLTVDGDFIALESVRLKSGKLIYAWALEGDIKADEIKSNLFELEWPPRSGKKINVPEVDKAAWFDQETARVKVNVAQVELIDRLIQLLN